MPIQILCFLFLCLGLVIVSYELLVVLYRRLFCFVLHTAVFLCLISPCTTKYDTLRAIKKNTALLPRSRPTNSTNHGGLL